MATTTNYGWTTPDDTALVKDGASAIRTLGTSIDTTTKNLNPQTTLGDIAYRSSTSNVNTRLALGTAGQVLRVNSLANAPEWGLVSGGLIYITGASFTTAATVSMASGVFTSTYDNYLVTLILTSSSAVQNLGVRVNNAGTPRTAANYYGNKTSGATATATTGGSSLNSCGLSATNFPQAMNFIINSPVSASIKTVLSGTGIGYPEGSGFGTTSIITACVYDVAEAHDGLTFTVGGTITGSYKVFGITNS